MNTEKQSRRAIKDWIKENIGTNLEKIEGMISTHRESNPGALPAVREKLGREGEGEGDDLFGFFGMGEREQGRLGVLLCC